MRPILLLTPILIALSGCESESPAELLQADAAAVEANKIITPLFVEQPVISRNPQRRVPLVAIVDVTASMPVKGSLEISDGINRWTLENDAKPADKLRLVAYGMRPEREHEIRVQLTEPVTGTTEFSEPISFTTPPLPDSFPPIDVTVSKPSKMEDGVLLFPVNLWRNDKSMMDYGYLIALDQRGEVVWFINSGQRTADAILLKNGHLLFQHGNYRHAFEIDLAGQIIRQWHTARLTEAPNATSIPVDIDTMHHEIAEHPNGNLWTLSTTLQKWDKYPTSTTDSGADWEQTYVVCDQLIEFEPDTGKVVTRLELTDYLDKKRFGYLSRGTFWKPKYDHLIKGVSRDWSHANALLLLPEENAVIVSFRHLDCLIKIDLDTKETVWILGNPDGWGPEWQKHFLKPIDPKIKWFYHQHGPQLTKSGIRLYDNGNYRTHPFEPPLPGAVNNSRIVEFAIDEKARTVKQLWEYNGSPDDMFYSPFYGEADHLPETGNYLVTDGGHIELDDGTPWNEVPGQHQWARIFEITGESPHEKVFEVRCENELKSPYGWSIYRSTKLKSLSDVRIETDRLPDFEDSGPVPADGPVEEGPEENPQN